MIRWAFLLRLVFFCDKSHEKNYVKLINLTLNQILPLKTPEIFYLLRKRYVSNFEGFRSHFSYLSSFSE